MLNQLEQRVLATLAYSHLFEYPLLSKEVHLRLVAPGTVNPSKNIEEGKNIEEAGLREVGFDQVRLVLEKLVKKKKIVQYQGYFLLKSGSMAWVEQRQRRNSNFSKKIIELKPLLAMAKKIPQVRGLALTGSLAVKNAELRDDVDLLVVTKPGGLWGVRFLLLTYASLLGKRGWPGQNKQQEWCFNLWLTETSLEIESEKRNLYTAYELSQVFWIYDQANLATKFLKENSWVKNYLPQIKKLKKRLSNQAENESCRLVGFLVSCLSQAAEKRQQQHLVDKVGIDQKNLGQVKAVLHGKQYGLKIIERWQQLIYEKI